MHKLKILLICLSVLFATCLQAQKVQFKQVDQDKKVEVFIDNKFFTAFIYPDNMEKQSLYPIIASSGKIITRGYPLQPRPFERTDHPHHVGMWFNFGDVNGLDFWNNSFAIAAAEKPKYGKIAFDKIISVNSKLGKLIVSANWMDINKNVLLSEQTSYVFSGKGNTRIIERITQLTAKNQITFTENKEGLLGMRLDRAFEEPATKPEIFLDAKGVETLVPVLNNEGVNGVYRNAEGFKAGEVWGKRSKWVALRAVKEGEVITIVILDHPNNLNYPAWSHARGYGLFASNNIGGSTFDKNATPIKKVLATGEQMVFKHKIIIGGELTDAEINQFATDFK
ncbi:MAG: PmoA family protein [Sediminibacterium sp.]|jgi:hypothetical protein|nr:PmoA family protein [Sediminibacterium sp.]